jgi:hypothetical protein
MRTIRWILVVPAAVVAWYAVFALGLFSHSYVEGNMCPPEDLVSGFCDNDTVQGWLRVIMHLFVGISAFAVVMTTAAVAPDHKERVAWATLAAGIVVAACFAVSAAAWSLFAVAAVGGAAAALSIVRFVRTRAVNR